MFRISMKNIGELINRPAWVITNEKCVDKACRIRNKNNYTIYGGRIVRISIEDAGSKYGLKRNETVTYTAAFGDGIEMDVKLVICDEDTTPYLDVVLFQNGNEVFCDAPGYYVLPEKFSANWDGRTFVANIKAVTA